MKKIIAIIMSLALVMSLGTMAFAAGSPQGDKTYKVTITSDREESGSSKDNYKVVQNGDTFEITADEDDDEYEFLGWEIIGEYEIVSGSLTSRDLVIRPLGDITINQLAEYIVEADEEPDDGEDKEEEGETNKSDKSPQTGNNIFFILGGIFAASFVIASISGKRIRVR